MVADDPLIVAYLALGSNSGDREQQLYSALTELSKFVRVEKISPVFETAHIGPPAPDHLNCAAEIRTSLEPEPLLDICHTIESGLGRDRAHEVKWGARPIDIDIILYGRTSIETGRVIIPHPRMMQRRFVLDPLAAIAPKVLIPGFDITVSDALSWPATQEQRVTQSDWKLPIAKLLE